MSRLKRTWNFACLDGSQNFLRLIDWIPAELFWVVIAPGSKQATAIFDIGADITFQSNALPIPRLQNLHLSCSRSLSQNKFSNVSLRTGIVRNHSIKLELDSRFKPCDILAAAPQKLTAFSEIILSISSVCGITQWLNAPVSKKTRIFFFFWNVKEFLLCQGSIFPSQSSLMWLH